MGRSPRRPPSLLCARSPPYVLSYVLLLVQMAGGGPLMAQPLFFVEALLRLLLERERHRDKSCIWMCDRAASAGTFLRMTGKQHGGTPP